MKLNSVLLLVAAGLFFGPHSAWSKPTYVKAFKTKYTSPAAKKIAQCQLCHVEDGPPQLNLYGLDFQKAAYDFAVIETTDSDGDGYTNVVEINAGSYPGNKDSKPKADLDFEFDFGEY